MLKINSYLTDKIIIFFYFKFFRTRRRINAISINAFYNKF